ncbi:DJ-1 protein-PfpI domain-containing protein [Mycena indigotica]|uniref:DJ-1 protein-PfpI domain-containing protein n=1 Tax=Mycena indigotica TaxID=2126181 RepID=A0A8H6TDX1_9AGAR|nr:DJ-1 protein-PfpI domain-containing protein [Mycena indigotica]KAF7315675.1 DJ-1 protein-PfpI domain-containing protein [Mycena indigotica]
MSQPSLTAAVCLFPNVTVTDYQGPAELLGLLSSARRGRTVVSDKLPDFTIELTYLSHTLEPVKPKVGPRVTPERTYDDAQEQFDIILVPGGPSVNPPSACNEFILRQSPGAQYILSVCTGSLILARLGLLNGHPATTNKGVFKEVKEETKDLPIRWMEKARWVTSDNKKIWTASGVTAGMDMAGGFVDHLVGKELGLACRSFLEMSVRDEGDDEFAAYHGLV